MMTIALGRRDNAGGGMRPGNLLLALVAALPALLLAALIAALLMVRPAGATEIECGGENVLTALQKSDPAAYQRVLAEGAAVPNGEHIAWKVEKPGLAPSFLLGTMHLTDPRVLAMPQAARDAWKQAQTVIVESDEIIDENKAMAKLLSKPELTMMMDGSTITGLLPPEKAKMLEAGLKQRGLSLPLVAKMQPWMISSFVSLPACEFARKAKGEAFLDQKIALDAKAEGKTLVGLETMEEQLSAMADLPVKFHLDALVETLAMGARMNDAVETMIQLYLAGDIGLTMPMLKSMTPPGSDLTQGYVAFEQRIVTDRNKVMATRAAPHFAKGGVFMAVGALHLPGPEGLVELLRGEGFTVTPAL